MSAAPYALVLDQLEPAPLLEQAEWIRAHIPLMQAANGSGKFYRNYRSYGFWHDSELPLIRTFVSRLRNKSTEFESVYGRPMKLDYVYLSYVENAAEETCLWHRDGYWWNGQFHLTICGNANILVKDGDSTPLIEAANGSLWYLNGTEYAHKIQAGKPGPRFELLAPCDFRPESSMNHRLAVSDTPERWIDGQHPALRQEQEIAVNYMKKSIAEGRASNLEVADWPV